MTCSPSRLMTRRSCSRTGAFLRRTAVTLAVVALCALATATFAGAAPGDLTLAITSVDASAPQATAQVQLGGPAAAGLGTLDKSAFSVRVDGVEVPLESATAAGDGAPLPVQVVLLIDESGSMKREAVAAAAAAARKFIASMRPDDTIAIQAFNEGFRTLQSFTGDQAALEASLDKLAPGKETALYDALIKSLQSFGAGQPGAARYLVLLSDGADTASAADLQAALSAARAAGIQIYAIGLKTEEFDSQPLVAIAEAAAGRYLETPDPEVLTGLYAGLAKEIYNQYLLAFTLPADAGADGVGRLEITVQAGGQTATADRGFFYPEPSTTSTTAASSGTVSTTVITTPVEPPGERSLMGRFLDWQWSDWIFGFVVFAFVFALLYLLSGVLFPKRNVLAEYGDQLDRRRGLEPRPLEEPAAEEGATSRLAGRVLAVRGLEHPLQRLIDDAALKFRASEFALIHFVSVVVVIIIVRVVGGSALITLLAGLVVVAAPLLWLSARGKKRRKAFEEQVPNTLVLLAGSLKAGQGFEQALSVAATEAPEPTASEFKRVLTQQRLGVVPEEALRSVAERMRSESFDWAVMSTIIQRQVGGNLAEVYEKTAATLRARATLRRQIQTLTAEGRISAVVLVALPFGVGAMIGIVNRGYLKPLYTTPMGLAMVGLSVALMIIGILWIRAITRVDA